MQRSGSRFWTPPLQCCSISSGCTHRQACWRISWCTTTLSDATSRVRARCLRRTMMESTTGTPAGICGKRKANKTKQNKTKQNKTKQNKTKQNKTKQNKAKQNKTKQNKTKQKTRKERKEKTRQDKTTPFGVNLMRSPVLSRAPREVSVILLTSRSVQACLS